MPDKPIIFSAPMVRALLDGRKTQTRRVLKPQPAWGAPENYQPMSDEDPYWAVFDADHVETRLRVNYAPGDRLWVREAIHWTGNLRFVADDAVVDLDRMPNGFTTSLQRITSIFMPRWASRLTLTVTEVRVQRLQEISTDDAIAEGISLPWVAGGTLAVMAQGIAKDGYRALWNSLHGPDAWEANPWVVAISFTVQRGNIDRAPHA